MLKRILDIKRLPRGTSKKTRLQQATFSTLSNLIKQYNPFLPNFKTIIRNPLPILHSNQQMLDIFSQNTISVTYIVNKNLRAISPTPLFPRTTKQGECSIEECNEKCNLWKNLLVVSTEFTLLLNVAIEILLI